MAWHCISHVCVDLSILLFFFSGHRNKIHLNEEGFTDLEFLGFYTIMPLYFFLPSLSFPSYRVLHRESRFCFGRNGFTGGMLSTILAPRMSPQNYSVGRLLLRLDGGMGTDDACGRGMAIDSQVASL